MFDQIQSDPDNNNGILDVAIIGAGFSGIAAGIKLLERNQTQFRIFDKAGEIGGTWHHNTYPGAACDVPSHLYCYSFEPNPDWSRVYSPQKEIKAYIEHCADKYGVMPYISLESEITRMEWKEIDGVWQIDFSDARKPVMARHIINASGGLHIAVYPDIPGRTTFSGPAMHTAHWDHNVDYKDKKIAIIGSAASAIQLIPELAKQASKLHVFQRTPNYIMPRMDRDYSGWEKQIFVRFPFLLRWLRQAIFMRLEWLLYPVTKRNSSMGRRMARLYKKHMHNIITDPELRDKLMPDYALGCKRILVSDDFLPALNRDNVDLITDRITSIEPEGVRTQSGALKEADILVFATGYDLEALFRSIDVIGEEGVNLAEAWADDPNAYRGAHITGFPNFHMVTGPNTGVGTTSIIYMVEQQLHFLFTLLDHAGFQGQIRIKENAQIAYNTHIQAALANTVWLSGCKSWYLSEDGKNRTLYPFNARTFAKSCHNVNWEDYDIRVEAKEAKRA